MKDIDHNNYLVQFEENRACLHNDVAKYTIVNQCQMWTRQGVIYIGPTKQWCCQCCLFSIPYLFTSSLKYVSKTTQLHWIHSEVKHLTFVFVYMHIISNKLLETRKLDDHQTENNIYKRCNCFGEKNPMTIALTRWTVNIVSPLWPVNVQHCDVHCNGTGRSRRQQVAVLGEHNQRSPSAVTIITTADNWSRWTQMISCQSMIRKNLAKGPCK